MNKTINGISNSKIRSLKNNDPQIQMSKHGYEYYRDRLPFQERSIYDKLKEGLLDVQKKIIVDSFPGGRYEKIFNSVLSDVPMIFHVRTCSLIDDGVRTTIIPEYQLSKSEYQRYSRECISKVKEFCGNEGEGDWDRLVSLHSALLKNIKYRETKNAHDITGPLIMHEGVCDGIAKTVKCACDAMKIPCFIIRGEAKKSDGIIGGHAWDAIKIKNGWRLFDFTFDITLNDSNPCKTISRMDYFSKSYEEMAKDHFRWCVKISTDDKGKDYFEHEKMVLKNQDELDRLILLSNDKPIEFAYKIDNKWRNYDEKKSLEHAVKKLTDVNSSGYRYAYSFNDCQRVGYIRIE